MERLEQNGVTAIVASGSNYVLWFVVNDQRIGRDHADFAHLKSRFNAPAPRVHEPARPGIEL